MRTREIPPEISGLLPGQDDRAFLERFVANEVPTDGQGVHFALKAAMSARRRSHEAGPCYPRPDPALQALPSA